MILFEFDKTRFSKFKFKWIRPSLAEVKISKKPLSKNICLPFHVGLIIITLTSLFLSSPNENKLKLFLRNFRTLYYKSILVLKSIRFVLNSLAMCYSNLDYNFRLVFMTRMRRVALTKSSLLLKIKWKHYHYLYRKWAELLSGTESHVTVSDAGKSKCKG